LNRKLAIALLVFANVMWGSSYAVAKVALEELPPPLLGALRITLASSLIWLALLWQARRPALTSTRGKGAMPASLSPIMGESSSGGEVRHGEKVPRRDALKMLGLGFLGLAVDYLLAYWGVSLSTATDASLMIIGEVIFTTLLSVWLLGERLGHRKLLGIATGVVGVVTLVLGSVSSSASGIGGLARAGGDLLILGGLLGASFYGVLGTGLSRKYRPLRMLGYAYTGAMLLWAPVLLWYLASGTFPAISGRAILGVIYLAVVTSFICQLVWFHVLRYTGANTGAITLFVQPLVGSLLGLLVLREPLTLALIVGGALIFAALYFTSIPNRKHVSSEYQLPEAPVVE
jgi:drug/metabolite transporter (DMT)-like permease